MLRAPLGANHLRQPDGGGSGHSQWRHHQHRWRRTGSLIARRHEHGRQRDQQHAIPATGTGGLAQASAPAPGCWMAPIPTAGATTLANGTLKLRTRSGGSGCHRHRRQRREDRVHKRRPTRAARAALWSIRRVSGAASDRVARRSLTPTAGAATGATSSATAARRPLTFTSLGATAGGFSVNFDTSAAHWPSSSPAQLGLPSSNRISCTPTGRTSLTSTAGAVVAPVSTEPTPGSRGECGCGGQSWPDHRQRH